MADHARQCLTCARAGVGASGLGDRARALGISASELARRAGCSRGTAHKALSGERIGSYAKARTISLVLSVPIEAVANGQEYYEQAVKKAAASDAASATG